ncbi:MAG: ABC transporter ATP-binding protein [Actinomycetia bacterium]|nr:ABC transporter ATP-binding protein [Actinomycetes bacterium]
MTEQSTKQAPLLQAEGVVKRYGGLAAVDGISFTVESGAIVGIAGPNGAGKTTLFDVVTGIVRADEGSITFAGEPIHKASVHHICQLGLARTFQLPSVFDTQTVAANVLAGAHFGHPHPWWSGLRTKRELLEATQRELSFAGLADRSAALAGPLAAFDKKRLMIASALASDPSLLFLDEPFGGLTPHEVDELMELLTAIRGRGITIVIIEHVMRALMALSDRVLIMNHGSKLFEGSPADVLADEEVVRVYLGRKGEQEADDASGQ